MGVLDGIKILELARVPPAEMPAMMLADMGADVLKIDSPDPERPAGDEWVRRTIHAFTNRNKRSMTLNLKESELLAGHGLEPAVEIVNLSFFHSRNFNHEDHEEHEDF